MRPSDEAVKMFYAIFIKEAIRIVKERKKSKPRISMG